MDVAIDWMQEPGALPLDPARNDELSAEVRYLSHAVERGGERLIAGRRHHQALHGGYERPHGCGAFGTLW